jgi:hypothetical protein
MAANPRVKDRPAARMQHRQAALSPGDVEPVIPAAGAREMFCSR